VTLTSTAGDNNQWYKDGVVIIAATGKTFTAFESGSYTVRTTATGITTTSVATVVTKKSIATPVITNIANNLLLSSAASGNQWYLNGNLIAGATSHTYSPTQSGNYTVRSTVDGCVSEFSAAYNFSITGIVDLGNNQFLSAYPNPLKGTLQLNWNINGVLLLNMEILNLEGKRMLFLRNIQPGMGADISALPSGVYLVKVFSDDNKFSQTLKVTKE
jgi:hypothetical protein